MIDQAGGAAHTILHLPNEILGICHNFLGPGHFVFIAPVCKRFKTVYLTYVSDEMITTGESSTSSILRARQYFAHTGNLSKKLALFWCFNTRYGLFGRYGMGPSTRLLACLAEKGEEGRLYVRPYHLQ